MRVVHYFFDNAADTIIMVPACLCPADKQSRPRQSHSRAMGLVAQTTSERDDLCTQPALRHRAGGGENRIG
jgi:hypothetical protein